jgi:hypothetical protein
MANRPTQGATYHAYHAYHALFPSAAFGREHHGTKWNLSQRDEDWSFADQTT